VSIYGGVWQKILEEEVCFKSRVKREGVIDNESGGDDSVDPTCVGW